MTAEAVVAEVARDAAFFRNSGGGVTFSGGEPLAQPELLLEMLGLLADRGIRAAVETCGHARPEDVAAVEPLVEAFLFDVKTLDPARHAELTGRDNALILANLRGLAARVPAKVTVRHAIIPGLNDDRGTQEALVDLMRELGLTRLDLEPYHPLGEAKYVSLGRACPCSPDPRALDEARVQEMVGYFRGRGLECDVA
jgi:pyruvate formate lyase activating enzyme